MHRLAYGIFGAAFALAMAMPAMAASLPSSKATVAIDDLISLGTACASAGTAAPCGANDDDTGWVTVLTTYIKTANQKDLVFDMALQCALLTDTTVRSREGDLDGANAEAGLHVRIKVTDGNGTVRYAVPANNTAAGEAFLGEDVDGVTYCNRFQQIEAKFAGLNCTADLDTGAVTCEDPEEFRLLLKTLEAHAFNFALADLVSGVTKVEVEARATAGAAVFGTALGEAHGEAFAGLGSLLVEVVRFIKDAPLTGVEFE